MAGDGDSAAGTGVLTAAAEAALARRVEELRARASTRRAAAEAAGRNQLAHVSEWARRGGTALALALAAARGGWFDDADEHTAVVAAEAALAAAGLSGAPALGGGDGNGGGMRRLPLAGARLLEVGMGSGLHAMLQGLEAAARRWATSARTPARECGLLSLRNRLCGRQAGGRLARALLMCVWWRRCALPAGGSDGSLAEAEQALASQRAEVEALRAEQRRQEAAAEVAGQLAQRALAEVIY